jgi:hypothetical protein
MNERIRQLAEQAGVKMNAYGRPIPASLASNFDELAQLIVQECISTLEEKIHRSIDNEGDEIWADLILKEHFGVEE